MKDSELIQSFLPSALAEEITRRYQAGSTALAQLVDHLSQRSQLEDLLASTIERAGGGGGGKFGSTRGSIRSNSGVGLLTSARQGSEEAVGLVPGLQREVDSLVRMHLHLSERINNEIVRPLQAFISTDAWSVAHSVEAKVRQMANEMKHHHEQIPKLSTRTVSKSARASQQAKQKLDDERSALVALQHEWQKRIAGLVDDFEVADVARIEVIRESALKFEHYKTEFFKAAQNGSGPVVDIAKSLRPSPQIIDVLSRDLQSSPIESFDPSESSLSQDTPTQPSQPRTMTSDSVAASFQSHRSESQGELDTAKDEAKPKGIFGMLRGKARVVKKKLSSSEISMSSSQHSRSLSSHVAAPSIISTAHTRDTRDSDGLSPGLAVASELGGGGDPRALPRYRGDSFASSSHSARLTAEPGPSMQRVEALVAQHTQKPSAGDFAEWVFTEGSQSGSGGAGKSQDPSHSSADSLVHIPSSILPEAGESTATEAKPIAVPAPIEPVDSGQGGDEPPVAPQPEAPTTTAAFVVDSWPEIGQPLASTPAVTAATTVGDASRIFGNLDESFRVPDTPFDVTAFEPFNADAGRSASPRVAAAGDLDMAFSIPSRPPKTAQAAVFTGLSQKDSVFGATDAFLVRSGTNIKQSPQLDRIGGSTGGGHRRSVSVDTADRSPSISELKISDSKSGTKEQDSEDESDDDNDSVAADQAFKVKFSIRDRAIRDNPDESKAALSRVTTMLRAAPTAQRRNRRDVRTMYVPSALPVTEESFGQSGAAAVDDDDQPLTPLPQRVGAPSGTTQAGSLVNDAFGGPVLSQTPLPQRNDADNIADPALAAAEDDSSGQKEGIPQTPATNELVHTDGAVREPAEQIAHAKSESTSGDVKAVDATEAPVQPTESSQLDSPVAGPVHEVALSDAKTLNKSEGSVRRRAPPPPPSAPPGSRARSIKQASQTSMLTAPSVATPDPDTTVATAESTTSASGSTEPDSKPLDILVAKSASCTVPEIAKPNDEEAPQVVPSSSVSPPSLSSHRGRRVGANSGPLAVTIHVRETLDFDYKYMYKDGPSISHLVTGEVTMHIQSAINPLELAPLRICIQRTEAAQWVANPTVVVLDASLTASKADGREWYRFVRPNLFAQVDAQTGADVAVFKYQVRGSGDERVMPAYVREISSCSEGVCARMVFCEPNSAGHFAGDTITDPAILLNMVGTVASQSSRPTAIWYQERNCLLWRVGDMHVPLPDTMSESEILALSRTMAFKARGDDQLLPGVIALKFEARCSRVLDAQISIVRVAAAGPLAPVSTVVAGPASRMVKSGKCTYFIEFNIDGHATEQSPSPAIAAGAVEEANAQPPISEEVVRDVNDPEPSNGTEVENNSSGDGAGHSSASSSEVWPSDHEDDAEHNPTSSA
ncbi:Suppressor of Profilin deletion [Coemansia sp. IMI 209128]|nr:Suppressor of Profilin deletion [Coemansia sp. IMI 209128]